MRAVARSAGLSLVRAPLADMRTALCLSACGGILVALAGDGQSLHRRRRVETGAESGTCYARG